MSHSRDTYKIEDLYTKCRKYMTKDELAIVKKAYELAEEGHRGQERKSGAPYIEHPIAVAQILTSIQADHETICAALMHDLLEDTDITKEEIEEAFGKNIADLVKGVTKIAKINFSTANDALIDYYKRLIVGMSEDFRVIIIKLADRLHNMRTLWALSEAKQKANAKETLEILAPIAHHLGIHKIKSELEDLSLKYLKPNVFYDIAERLNSTKLDRDKSVVKMIESLSNLLNEHHIPNEIKGRSKSIYSIYKKLEKGRKFSDIYDLLAVRIFVNTEQECYAALGVIHSKFKPIPGRFKDFVAVPKANGYQSLHTTVFGVDGYLFEIQIRTYEMDEIAENGVASHWAYKEHKNLKNNGTNLMEDKLQFFKQIMELNDNKMSSEDFVESVKAEILNNNIYVFTPKGDVIEMPKNSTPVDFAYRIHTRVGETTTGAIINGNIEPLDYKLQDNDIVKIITNKSSPGPSKEWLNFVASSNTRNKIRAFFLKSEKENFIERGEDELNKLLRKKGVSQSTFLSEENLKTILAETKMKDLEELLLHIGNNKYSANFIYEIIYKPKEEIEEVKFKDQPKLKESAVIVDGEAGIKVKYASCCHPVKGDDIIGFITRNHGITIHRKNCFNVSGEDGDGKLLNCKWDDAPDAKFLTSILIEAKKYENAPLEITKKCAASYVNIDSFKTIFQGDVISYILDIWVRNKDHLEKLFNDLNKFSFIINIERIMK